MMLISTKNEVQTLIPANKFVLLSTKKSYFYLSNLLHLQKRLWCILFNGILNKVVWLLMEAILAKDPTLLD